MPGIVDAVKKVAENELKKVMTTELGTITSVFPHADASDNDNYECNVKLKDKDLELHKVPSMAIHNGLANIPHVGDLVVVTFVNGDVNAPIILGRLYNDEDRPPVSKEEEIIYKPPYSKNTDLKRINIVLPGKDENVNLEIHDDVMTTKVGKSMVTIKDAGKIELKTEPGKTTIIVLDDKGLRIDTEADIQIHSKGSLSIECDKDLSFKAQNISMESQQAMKFKSSSSFDMQSQQAMSLKSSMSVNIEMSMDKVVLDNSGIVVSRGKNKVALTDVSVSVNDGALDVI